MTDYTKPKCKKLEALTATEYSLIRLIRTRQQQTIFPLRLEITLTRETIKWQEKQDG